MPSTIIGDVNEDGEFDTADVILLQNWLIDVPDTYLANYKACNLCADDRLNVFDFCMMKRKLTDQMSDS